MANTTPAGAVLLTDGIDMPDITANFTSGVGAGCEDYYFKISLTHFHAIKMRGSQPIVNTSEVYPLIPNVLPSGTLSGVAASAVKVGNVYWIAVASNSSTQSSYIFKFTPGVGLSNPFTDSAMSAFVQYDCSISPDGEYFMFSGGNATAGAQKVWLYRRNGDSFSGISEGSSSYTPAITARCCSFGAGGYFVVGHSRQHFYAYKIVNGVVSDLGRINITSDANQIVQACFDPTGTYLFYSCPATGATRTGLIKRNGDVFTDVTGAATLVPTVLQFAKWGTGDLILCNTNLNSAIFKLDRTTDTLTSVYYNALNGDSATNFARAVVKDHLIVMNAYVAGSRTRVHSIDKSNSPVFGAAIQNIAVANNAYRFDFKADAKVFETMLDTPAISAENVSRLKGSAVYANGPTESNHIVRAISKDGQYRATFISNRLWLWKWNPTTSAWDTDGVVLATNFPATARMLWLDCGYLATYTYSDANNVTLYRITKTAAQTVGSFEVVQTLATSSSTNRVSANKNVLCIDRVNGIQEFYTYNRTTKLYVANRNTGFSTSYRVSNGKWIVGASATAISNISIVSATNATSITPANVGIANANIVGSSMAFTKDGRFFYFKRTTGAVADWEMYDTTTLPWTLVPNPFPQKTDSFSFLPPEISLNYEAAVGQTSNTNVAVYRTTEPEADYVYPTYGLSIRTGDKRSTQTTLNYPVFGVAGNVNIPISGNAVFTYPVLGIQGSAGLANNDTVLPFTFGVETAKIKIEVPEIKATNEDAPPHVYGSPTYPVYGIAALGSQPYSIETFTFNYPVFGMAGEVNVPTAVMSIMSYPVYKTDGLIAATEPEIPTPIDYGITSTNIQVEGYSGIASVIIAPPYAYGLMTYPKFGLPAEVKLADYGEAVLGFAPYRLNATDTIFLETNTELGYPVFGVPSEFMVAKRADIELVHPNYSMAVDLLLSVDIEELVLGYPTYTLNGIGGSPNTSEFFELAYPALEFSGRVNEIVHGDYELTYPTYGIEESYVITDDRNIEGELLYPTFGAMCEIYFNTAILIESIYPTYGISGEITVPEAGEVKNIYPVFGTAGEVNVPIAVLSQSIYPVYAINGTIDVPEAGEGEWTYSVYGMEGEIIPTYKIPDMIVKYPVFGIAGVSGYPDRIFTVLTYPRFGTNGLIKGAIETIESTLNYPAFGVSAILESYLSVRLDMALGKVEIDSEVKAFKPNRRAVIIRR